VFKQYKQNHGKQKKSEVQIGSKERERSENVMPTRQPVIPCNLLFYRKKNNEITKLNMFIHN